MTTSNLELAHAVPSFNSRKIYDDLQKLGVCFDVRNVQEHIIHLNQFCHIWFRVEKRTPFHITLKMEVFDQLEPTFEMTIQVYLNQKIARALTLEQGGCIRKNALDSLNNIQWNVLEEVNSYFQTWLTMCLEAEQGPAAKAFVVSRGEELGLCIA